MSGVMVVTNDARMKDPIDPQRFALAYLELLTKAGGGDPRRAMICSTAEAAAMLHADGAQPLGDAPPLPAPDIGVQLTHEQMLSLGAAADGKFAELAEIFRDIGGERATFVRYLRVKARCTWRRVAELCARCWEVDAWVPESNQIAGMALCDAAAKHFGDDYMAGEWN